MTITVTLGFTLADRLTRQGFTPADPAERYIPAADGYRVGAEQYEMTLDLHWQPASEDAVDVAQLLWEITSAPDEVVEAWEAAGGERGLLSKAMDRALDESLQVLPRALGVGDTVTVAGVSLVCLRAGWRTLDAVLSEDDNAAEAALALEQD